MVKVGPWDIDTSETLGRGGFGVVWSGRHRRLGVPVAIKVLPSADSDRELRAMGALHHPGIVKLLDVGVLPEHAVEHPGVPFLVMERAWGRPLTEGTARPWRDVVLGILDALAHAHARGILHGDLSPANVHVTGGRVRLVDFGLATFLREPPDVDRTIRGTAAYMSPEQRAGRWEEFGPWTDLFALGAIAYALITGGPPTRLPPPPVDPDVDRWLGHLLAVAPEHRPHRAADVAVRLPGIGRGPSGTRQTPLAVTLTAAFQGGRAMPSREGVGTGPVLALTTCPPTWRTETAHAPVHGLLSTLGASGALSSIASRPLVGRIGERDALWQRLRRVHDTRIAEAVVLHGAHGVGRTRLVRWLCERAHELGVIEVVAAECWSGEAPWVTGPRVGLVTVEDADPGGVALARALLGRRETPVLVAITAPAPLEGLDELAVAPLPPDDHRLLVRELLGLAPSLAGVVEAHTRGIPGAAVAMVEAWRDTLQPGPLGLEPTDGHIPALPDTTSDVDQLMVQAGAQSISGDYTGTLALLAQVERTLREGDVPGTDERWGRSGALEAETLMLLGRFEVAEQRLVNLVALAEAHDWPVLPRVQRILATLYSESGRPAQALAHVRIARDLLRTHDLPLDRALCLQLEGNLAHSLGDLRSVGAQLAAASAAFDALARPDQQVACDGTRALALAYLGRTDDARAVLARASETAEALGGQSLVAYLSLLQATTCLEAGDLPAAQAFLENADTRLARIGNPGWWAYVSWARASLDLYQGRIEAARDGLTELVDIFEKLDPQHANETRLQLAWLALRSGAAATAEGLARQALNDAGARQRMLAHAALAWVAALRGDTQAEAKATEELEALRAFTGSRERLLAALLRRERDLG